MERYDLPEGWERLQLGELVEIIYGSGLPAKKRSHDGSVPVYGSNGIVGRHNSSITKSPVIIIGRKGSVGAVNFSEIPCWPIDTAFFIDTFPKNILAKWLFLFLSNCNLSHLNQEGPKPGIRRDDLYEVEIPVPPLPEQCRIVKRIEELNRRVGETRKLRATVIDQVEKYIPAAIASVFEDGQDKGWVTKKIKYICEKPQYGYTESACHEPIGPKFLRITDIQNGKVDWGNVPYCKCDNVDKYRLKSCDIVFARTGATTGKSFLIKEPPEAVFASYLIRLRVGTSILPEFLYWYFQSSSYWESVSSGIEDGNRPNMNGTKLANLEVLFPEDKKKQRSVVKYLNSLQEKVEELYLLQRETENELAAFTPALLAKAFRGDL